MSHVTVETVNGVKDITCSGGTHWFIVYNLENIFLWGTHIGQITSGDPNVTIEYTYNEADMNERILEIGLPLLVDEPEGEE